MAGRRTNLALLVLIAGASISGMLMFAIGSGWNRWLTLAHGAIGVCLVAVSPWKSAITRRGIHRRGIPAAAPSIALGVFVTVALATGFLHRAGVRHLGSMLLMRLHVGAALLAVPLAVWHVRSRPVRPRRADLNRRAILRGGLLAGGSALVTVVVPHAGGRVTRSLQRGSFNPAAMPVTQWLNDDIPRLVADEWRLRVAERRWSLAELDELADDELVATLDCTGGWYAHQRWTGIWLSRLLEASDAGAGRSVEVRSVTGYARRFPYGDTSHLLLATRVEGAPLSPGHGFPARVVAPSRRGFWWVKWVARVRVDDQPWWWQPPFPLT